MYCLLPPTIKKAPNTNLSCSHQKPHSLGQGLAHNRRSTNFYQRNEGGGRQCWFSSPKTAHLQALQAPRAAPLAILPNAWGEGYRVRERGGFSCPKQQPPALPPGHPAHPLLVLCHCRAQNLTRTLGQTQIPRKHSNCK